MSFCCCINFICLSFVTFYKKEKALLQRELQIHEQNVERYHFSGQKEMSQAKQLILTLIFRAGTTIELAFSISLNCTSRCCKRDFPFLLISLMRVNIATLISCSTRLLVSFTSFILKKREKCIVRQSLDTLLPNTQHHGHLPMLEGWRSKEQLVSLYSQHFCHLELNFADTTDRFAFPFLSLFSSLPP